MSRFALLSRWYDRTTLKRHNITKKQSFQKLTGGKSAQMTESRMKRIECRKNQLMRRSMSRETQISRLERLDRLHAQKHEICQKQEK